MSDREAKDLLPAWVLHLLNNHFPSDFYGKITLHYKKGEVTHVREEQTFVPPSTSDTEKPEVRTDGPE